MSNYLREDLATYSKELESYFTTSSNFGIVRLDSKLSILECNLGFMRLLGPHQNPVGKLLASYIEMDSSHPQCREELRLRLSRESGKDGIIHCQFIQKEDGYILLCERLVLTESRVIEKMGGMTEELISMQRELIKKSQLQEMQTIELQTINNSLQESEEKYRAIVDAYDGFIYICSKDFRIEFMNNRLIERTGRNATGEYCYKALHNLDSICDWCVNKEVFQGESVTWEIKSPKDGRWYECSNSPIFNSDGTVSKQAMINDTTERKLSEQRIQRLNNLYAALNECSQAILHCTSEEELFEQICRNAVQRGGLLMAWVGLFDPETGMVSPVASFGEGIEYLHNINISVDADNPTGRGPTGSAIRNKQPFWCQDYQNDPVTVPWHQRGRQFGWKASASLPLYKNGSVIGALTIYAAEMNAFDETSCHLLYKMSIDVSHALDNFIREKARKGSEEALYASEKRYRLLADNATDNIWTMNLDGKFRFFRKLVATG